MGLVDDNARVLRESPTRSKNVAHEQGVIDDDNVGLFGQLPTRFVEAAIFGRAAGRGAETPFAGDSSEESAIA
jgi:hypothetical protein